MLNEYPWVSTSRLINETAETAVEWFRSETRNFPFGELVYDKSPEGIEYIWGLSEAKEVTPSITEFLPNGEERTKSNYGDTRVISICGRWGKHMNLGVLIRFELVPMKNQTKINADYFKHDFVERKAVELLDKIESESKGVALAASAPTERQGSVRGSRLWDIIPNGKYRQIVQLWHETQNQGEVARRLGMRTVDVTKRLSEFRKLYGEEVVPLKKNMVPLKLG